MLEKRTTIDTVFIASSSWGKRQYSKRNADLTEVIKFGRGIRVEMRIPVWMPVSLASDKATRDWLNG